MIVADFVCSTTSLICIRSERMQRFLRIFEFITFASLAGPGFRNAQVAQLRSWHSTRHLWIRVRADLGGFLRIP